MTIHDISGREVFSGVNPPRLTPRGTADRGGSAAESFTWDASAFPAGIYFARLESGGKISTVKMALVR